MLTGNSNGRDDNFGSNSSGSAKLPSSGSAGGQGGSDGSDPCDIVQTAPLNSPQPVVVQGLKANDILDVILNTSGTRAVLEVHKNGQVVGSLTHRGHINIINCIQQGHQYQATVTSIQGGSVQMQVERV